jgi:hypothetical protein
MLKPDDQKFDVLYARTKVGADGHEDIHPILVRAGIRGLPLRIRVALLQTLHDTAERIRRRLEALGYGPNYQGRNRK